MSKVDFFKNTIDEILEEFPNSKALFKEISILFDNFQGNLKYQTYRKEILISILTEEKKPNNLKFSDLENIKDQIILEFYLSDSTIDPYLSIIEYFRSILKNNKFFKSLNSLDSWTKALKLAVYEAKISNSYSKFIDPSDIKTVYSRLYNVGKSARYLRNIGYKVWAEDGKIRISRKEEIRVINDICNKIKSLGGKNVLFRIIEKLKKYNYSKFQNRFLFPLHHSQGTESKDPYFPIGYIFNLSLKYLSYLPSSKNPEKDWE
ncbi:MAG TPA: hypothetical protein PKK94_08460, partial [Leptospiraceae bacterium]|nr:hypothetical protein [Leptospiraceae bacterium]